MCVCTGGGGEDLKLRVVYVCVYGGGGAGQGGGTQGFSQIISEKRKKGEQRASAKLYQKERKKMTHFRTQSQESL